MQEIDSRIVKVGIEVNGQIKTYDGLYIMASGTRFGNSNLNECEVIIANLDKATQDFILTETSPFNANRTPKKLTLDAGRQSWGTTRVFSGNIVSVQPSQPPDIALTIKCLTNAHSNGDLVSRSQPGQAKLSQIAKQVASDIGVSLDFQATDKQISNYGYSGGALNQVNVLGTSGDVDAYVDNDRLIVKNANIPLTNVLTVVNLDTGMVGIPEITEQGIKVQFLLDGTTTLGGSLQLTSKIYPTVNGTYLIYKLGFRIANREEPFYWVAEGIRK